MTIVTTPRLVLVPLDGAMVAMRISNDEFDLACAVDGSELEVHFPTSWPGDPLAGFPELLSTLESSGDVVIGSFTIVDRATSVAVGMLGTKGPVLADGTVEIGYGLGVESWGRGFATEAVGAFCSYLFRDLAANVVRAETTTWNVASQRVLEKNGFARVGERWDEEDGDLVVWELGFAR